jgi:sulfur carrier protein
MDWELMSKQILVNGESKDLKSEDKLDQWIQTLDLPHLNVAVAINSEVVPRSQWSQILVHEGDKIEIIQAVGGG